MKNKKNIIIGALVGVIMLMAVGYAALAQVLTINGKANIDAEWDVEITGITEGTMTGATTKGNLTFDSTSATFEVDLAYPGAKAVYNVAIENKGTIDAKLSSITGVDTANAADPVEIQYTVTGVAANDVLEAEDTTTAVVTVEWVSATEGNDTIPETTTKTATINLNYVQNT